MGCILPFYWAGQASPALARLTRRRIPRQRLLASLLASAMAPHHTRHLTRREAARLREGVVQRLLQVEARRCVRRRGGEATAEMDSLAPLVRLLDMPAGLVSTTLLGEARDAMRADLEGRHRRRPRRRASRPRRLRLHRRRPCRRP